MGRESGKEDGDGEMEWGREGEGSEKAGEGANGAGGKDTRGHDGNHVMPYRQTLLPRERKRRTVSWEQVQQQAGQSGDGFVCVHAHVRVRHMWVEMSHATHGWEVAGEWGR